MPNPVLNQEAKMLFFEEKTCSLGEENGSFENENAVLGKKNRETKF